LEPAVVVVSRPALGASTPVWSYKAVTTSVKA
jgi:hypothetical protein